MKGQGFCLPMGCCHYSEVTLMKNLEYINCLIPLSSGNLELEGMVIPILTNLANGREQMPIIISSNNLRLLPRYRFYKGSWYMIRQRLDPQPDNSMKRNPVLDTDIYRLTKNNKWKQIQLDEFTHHTYIIANDFYRWQGLGIILEFMLEWRESGGIIADAIIALPKPTLKEFAAPEDIHIEQNKTNRKSDNIKP